MQWADEVRDMKVVSSGEASTHPDALRVAKQVCRFQADVLYRFSLFQ